jgi:hypothetical protein
MPLHWTIDSKAKLLTVVAEGDVTRAEFESYLDVIDQADARVPRSRSRPRLDPETAAWQERRYPGSAAVARLCP